MTTEAISENLAESESHPSPSSKPYEHACESMEELIDTDVEQYVKTYEFALHYSISGAHRVKVEQHLGMEPYSVQDFYNHGVTYLLDSDFVQAKASFEKAIELSPDHAGSYYNLAQLALQAGDKETYVAHLKKFSELEKEKQKYFDGGGYYQAGRYGAALTKDTTDYLQQAKKELGESEELEELAEEPA